MDSRSPLVAVALHRLVVAQRVVKRKGCLFVGRMGCRPLGRSDLVAAHTDFLSARKDWHGHTRLRLRLRLRCCSRRIAIEVYQSALAGESRCSETSPSAAVYAQSKVDRLVINGGVQDSYSHLHRSLRVLRTAAPDPRALDHLRTVWPEGSMEM